MSEKHKKQLIASIFRQTKMVGRPRTAKTPLAQRLASAAGDFTIEQIAGKTAYAVGTVGSYLRGDSIPDAEFLRLFIEMTGADSRWLVMGEAVAPAPGFEGIGPEFALIPRYAVEASAGPGLAVLEETEIERIAFRLEWLREIGLDPEQAAMLTARGDSMGETIPDGALMLVDKRKDQPIISGCIYVIVLDGDLLVKRVSRNVDKTLDLISDNPIYPIQKISQTQFDGLFIAGRVFWIGRKI